jgi:hypothetical protein
MWERMYKTINWTKTADPLPVFINCLIFYEPPFFLAKKYVTPPPCFHLPTPPAKLW